MTRLSNAELVAKLEEAARVFGAEGNAPGLRELAELVGFAADRLAIAPAMSAGAADALFERQRQVEQEGWTPAHDDQHGNKELAYAASAYLGPLWVGGNGVDMRVTSVPLDDLPPIQWTWDREWWKPGGDTLADYRRRLVKGVALGIAEIDRVDRMGNQLVGAPEYPYADKPPLGFNPHSGAESGDAGDDDGWGED